MKRRLAAATLVGAAVGSAPLHAQAVRSVGLSFDNDGFNLWIPPRQRTDWFYTTEPTWRSSRSSAGSSRAFTRQPEGHTFGTLGLVLLR